MEEEFVAGDRRIRLRGLVFLAIVVVLVLLERLTSPDPARAFKSSVDRLLIVSLTAAALLFAASIYLLRMGVRTKRSGRWPPPGMSMAVRTKIRHGKYATWSWIVLVAAAGIFMIQGLVGIYAWYWISRLEPDPVFKANLNHLRTLVARDPEKDARAAIDNGNLAFFGVAGFSVMIPAGDEPDIGGCLRRADKVSLIRGTSDVVHGAEHLALIQQATRYAARYNALIAKQRGLRTAGGCRPSNSGVQRAPADGRR